MVELEVNELVLGVAINKLLKKDICNNKERLSNNVNFVPRLNYGSLFFNTVLF